MYRSEKTWVRRAAAEPRWYTLMRRAAGEDVAGRVQLAFQWDITARGLLALKLQALERVPSSSALPSLPRDLVPL